MMDWQPISEAPKVNSRWRHTSGTEYTVAVITNQGAIDPDSHPVTVVYFSDNDVFWSRPLEGWDDCMTEVKSQ